MNFENARVFATAADPTLYHAEPKASRGDKQFPVSSSALKEFARCPRRWKAGYELPSAACRDFGSLLDVRLLTPEQFSKRFAMKPPSYVNGKGEEKPWNANSNKCREWLEENDEKQIVSREDIADADAAVARLLSDETAAAYLEASDRQVWVTGEWHCPVSGVVVPAKCLIDLVPRAETEFARTLGDLKTDSNAETLEWQRKAFKYGYHIQAAWNLGLYNAATEGERNTFCFLVIENFEPWEPARKMLDADFLKFGQQEVERLMRQYCACVESGFWPGYDDTDEATQGWSIAKLEPWLEQKQLFAPKYEIPGIEEGENDPEWMKEEQNP